MHLVLIIAAMLFPFPSNAIAGSDGDAGSDASKKLPQSGKAKNICDQKAQGAQGRFDALSIEVSMNQILTEGMSGVTKIDIESLGLSEFAKLKSEVEEILRSLRSPALFNEALSLGRRIRKYSVNATSAVSDAKSIGFRSSNTIEESQLWEDLARTLTKRYHASEALIDQLVKEFFGEGRRSRILSDINSTAVETVRALPLVEFFNRPVVLDMTSGLGIRGTLFGAIADNEGIPAYVKFIGPTVLIDKGMDIQGQGSEQHLGGYGTPVGELSDGTQLEKLSEEQLTALGIAPGNRKELQFKSGVIVEGLIKNLTWSKETGSLILITFEDCHATFNGKHLFKPSWGTYDMGVGKGLYAVWNVAEFQ